MLKRFLFLMVLVFLALLIPTGARAQCPPGAYGPGCSSSSGSGGGVGAGAAPIVADYLSSACPVANTSRCYFTFADTKEDDTCSWTTTTTITCADGPFLPADVGKNIMGGQSCGADGTSGDYGGMIATTTAVTIATY